MTCIDRDENFERLFVLQITVDIDNFNDFTHFS